MNSLALMVFHALLCLLPQDSGEVGWDLVVDGKPPLPSVLCSLFMTAFLVVAIAHLARNWILVPPFRRAAAETLLRAVMAFRRQALSLRRWMILNVLVWAILTVWALLKALVALSAVRTVPLWGIASELLELIRPSLGFICTLTMLYVVRWHILWRAERLERLHDSAAAVSDSFLVQLGNTPRSDGCQFTNMFVTIAASATSAS